MDDYWAAKVNLYRQHADRFKIMAEEQETDSTRSGFLEIAQQYESLAKTIESMEARALRNRAKNRAEEFPALQTDTIPPK